MLRTGITFLFIFLLYTLTAQVVINEASNRNFTQVYDEDGERNDWIELYNTGTDPVDLSDWALSDKTANPELWKFGNNEIPAKGHLLVHASGKDRKAELMETHWETAIMPTGLFSYIVPTANTPSNWYQPGFDDSLWETGQAGFGYGDNDDRTLVPTGSLAVFARKRFSIPDTSAIISALLHVDYDDGFIAYLNGTVIARANVNEGAGWNTTANGNREAQMYSGGEPEAFNIDPDLIKAHLLQGENIFAIQVHNVSNSSSDMSLIPFLSFALKEGFSYFSPVPTWFSENATEQLHANFKISGAGEMVFLSRGGVKVDSLYVPRLMTNHSIGRTVDGGEETGIFTRASPGSANLTSHSSVNAYTNSPVFSPRAGYFNSTVDVSMLTSEANASIRYTLDGSEPTAGSALYSNPIRISSTKVIRARVFVEGKITGVAATSTYLINEDYTLPVLSVSTNHSNLYGNNGIFTNWQQSSNIPSHVEYFDKSQKLAFALNTGMQVDGGAGGSRSLPQHSFRIEPGNGSLGDGDLKYKLMHRRPNRDNFPSFYLRNGSNQHLKLKYKDGLQVTALGRNTYTYYSAYEPIVVFINGGYFGVYELREKINYDFLEDNLNMDIDSLDFLGVSYFKGQQLEALRGSIDPYIDDFNHFQQLDIQSEDYLEEIDKFLDIKSYTDYIIAESWVGNNDWPFNNIKMFRCVGTNMRWQWAINDLEWALNPNGWTTSSFNHIDFMLGQGRWNYYTGYWFNMVQNPGYKAYFINRFADLMNTNYHFSVIGPLENEMYHEIFPEMEGQYRRWGSSNVTAQLNTFTNNHNIFRSELEKRSSFVRQHLRNHFNLRNEVSVTLDVEPQGAGSIQISTVVPNNYPWEGIYFTDVEIEVTALPNPGYKFNQWSNNSFVDNIFEAVQYGEFTSTQLNFKAYFEPEHEADYGVVISEFNYKPGLNFDSPDWVEFCNYSPVTVNLKDWYFTDDNPGHVFVFQNDLVLAPGERVVVASNYTRFRQVYPDVIPFQGEFSFGFGTPTDEINLFNNKGERVASVHYSDNYPWALSNDQAGRSLELRTPGKGQDGSSAWFRGCIGGSPGQAYQNCNEEIVNVPEMAGLKKSDIKVYPIPADDYINVDVHLDEGDRFYHIAVYDLMGNLIDKQTSGNANQGWHTVQLSLAEAKANLILLKVNTNTSSNVLKVLKMN
jgi:hypothetical protein